MDEDKPKSTVEFKLTSKGQSPALWLLHFCILETMPKDFGKDELSKTEFLLRAYRYQYYRAITSDPSQRRPFTYALNCPPCGFDVHPKTKTCKNPRVCPWCFVRLRLLKAFSALLAVPDEVRHGHQVLVWKRDVPDNGKLPFLRANY